MIELITTTNIIIVISVILNIIFLIGIRNLLKQNEQLEDRLINTIGDIKKRVNDALNNMRSLDNRQVFEKDDEVGVTFDEMKKIIEKLENEL